MSGKRGRGRPKGSEIPDAARLRAVAKLVVSDGLKATTAMRKVAQDSDSVVRRLQRKWKIVGVRFLAELAPKPTHSPAQRPPVVPEKITGFVLRPAPEVSAALQTIAIEAARAFAEARKPLQVLASQFQEARKEFAAIGMAYHHGITGLQAEFQVAARAFQEVSPHIREEMRKAAQIYREYEPHIQREAKRFAEALREFREQPLALSYAPT